MAAAVDSGADKIVVVVDRVVVRMEAALVARVLVADRMEELGSPVVAPEASRNFHWVESAVVVAVGRMGQILRLDMAAAAAAVGRAVVAAHLLGEVLVVVAGLVVHQRPHLQVLVLLWCYFALNYRHYALFLPFNCPELHCQ